MALAIPIISTFDNRGIKGAIREFKNLETKSQKAQFAIKKAASLQQQHWLVWPLLLAKP
jgi:hypothetical protein